VFTLIFSPHNVISFNDFAGSFLYESSVALGNAKVFYTTTFEGSTPVFFQLQKVFPPALGWPLFLIFIVAFFGLNGKKRSYNILRLSWLAYFLPTAFAYTKWTRFMAPVMPLMIVITLVFAWWAFERVLEIVKKILAVPHVKIDVRTTKNLSFNTNLSSAANTHTPNPYILNSYYGAWVVVCFIFMIPGIMFLSIYTHEDTRFAASRWIYKNIPSQTIILNETGNVINLPVPPKAYTPLFTVKPFDSTQTDLDFGKSYQTKTINFYELDNPQNGEGLSEKLAEGLQTSEYILVPSRRLFANYTCNNPETGVVSNSASALCVDRTSKYPLLNKYYEDLFSGASGFTKVAQFDSFPTLDIFGWKAARYSDEHDEETWSVFDHPVIRIYKRS
jgi:hypothetical protein